jgi:hypothetical protein
MTFLLHGLGGNVDTLYSLCLLQLLMVQKVRGKKEEIVASVENVPIKPA